MISDDKKIQIPSYIKKILKNQPKLRSGRKNYKNHEKRISDTIKLIKKFVEEKNN